MISAGKLLYHTGLFLLLWGIFRLQNNAAVFLNQAYAIVGDADCFQLLSRNLKASGAIEYSKFVMYFVR